MEGTILKKIVIIGASGHGKVIADIARLKGYEDIIFLDDDISIVQCGKYPVKGGSLEVNIFIDNGYDVIIAIGNAQIRQRIQNTIFDKSKIVTLIHPSAVVADEVLIGRGTVIMAGTVVNPGTRIGEGCIINTGATIDHDNRIEDYVHVSVGAHLAGTVKIGRRTWIGAGAVVSNNIEICDDCMIGAGAVVIGNINDRGTYVGVPASKLND